MMTTGTIAWAQKAYTVSTDDKTGFYVFRGPVTFEDIKNEKNFTWFKESIQDYKPEYPDLNYLTNNLYKYTMVIFLGTWCDDSHYLVPKLYVLLQKLNYPLDRVSMFGVDRDKNTNGKEKEEYKVSKVPTVILYHDGKEVGRITETVEKSIENGLAEIIKKDQ